jgi:hypothetical protein
VSVTIYVEGGGNQAATKSRCRRGFSEFFKKILLPGQSPRVVACGSRNEALDYFRIALKQDRGPGVVLLVDSEAPITPDAAVWPFLKGRDGWDAPTGATEDNTHLMVQCVESWFLADKPALAAFYGQGFNLNALPGQPNVERIPKAEVFQALEQATRNTRTKGAYGKGSHGFDLMEHIDPSKVRTASVRAERFFQHLLALSGRA